MSRCRYTVSAARESRHPSMTLAWFSSSESTRTPGPPRTVSTPKLAANPVGKQTAASVPFQSASASSSSLWMGRVPVTRRDAPDPAPHCSSASCAAATTAGCVLNPR